MSPGDTVSVLPPFQFQFPDQYIVQRVSGSVCSLSVGDFDDSFLSLVVAGDGTYTPPPVEVTVSEKWITLLEFRKRFTLEETAAIYALAKTEPIVQAYLDDLNAAAMANSGNVNLSDDRMNLGLGFLVSKGVLDSSRTAEIVS